MAQAQTLSKAPISPSGNLGGKVTYQNGSCQVELSIQGIAKKIHIDF
jgi:hypothetical protein